MRPANQYDILHMLRNGWRLHGQRRKCYRTDISIEYYLTIAGDYSPGYRKAHGASIAALENRGVIRRRNIGPETWVYDLTTEANR